MTKMLEASDTRKRILSSNVSNVTLKTMPTLSKVLCGRRVLLTSEHQSEYNQHWHISLKMDNDGAGLWVTSGDVCIKSL
jgi:hypothetical protein